MTARTIYLDHHATTPLDRRALDAMAPYFLEEYGNASSATHDWGRRAAAAVEEARHAVADLIGAEPEEIVFTAGATEADNLAIKGCARALRRRGCGTHLVTSAIEHKAVLLSVKDLEAEGFENTVVPPDSDGIVDPARIEAAIREDTILVSVMTANSEIGTIQPAAEIGALCRRRGVVYHTDATQSVGRLPVDVSELRCDLLSLSAHKFHGPKGVGALYVRTGIEVEPLFSGGGQERGLRSGTLNVPGIVGMGVVARFPRAEVEEEAARQRELRDRLWAGIRERIPDARLNGCPRRRLPGNLNVVFPGIPSGDLIRALNGFALSTGSACQSGRKSPSEVLLAIGCDPDAASCAVRFGLGRGTTADQVDEVLAALARVVPRLRQRVAP